MRLVESTSNSDDKNRWTSHMSSRGHKMAQFYKCELGDALTATHSIGCRLTTAQKLTSTVLVR